MLGNVSEFATTEKATLKFKSPTAEAVKKLHEPTSIRYTSEPKQQPACMPLLPTPPPNSHLSRMQNFQLSALGMAKKKKLFVPLQISRICPISVGCGLVKEAVISQVPTILTIFYAQHIQNYHEPKLKKKQEILFGSCCSLLATWLASSSTNRTNFVCCWCLNEALRFILVSVYKIQCSYVRNCQRCWWTSLTCSVFRVAFSLAAWLIEYLKHFLFDGTGVVYGGKPIESQSISMANQMQKTTFKTFMALAIQIMFHYQFAKSPAIGGCIRVCVKFCVKMKIQLKPTKFAATKCSRAKSSQFN